MDAKSRPPSRRRFLATASQGVAGAVSLALGKHIAAGGAQFDGTGKESFAADLLNLVNGDRAEAGVSRLSLDDLACTVADRHAHDMATGDFLSHWGRDGLKPYQRYSFAGGMDAVAENESAAHQVPSTGPKYTSLTLSEMHRTMHDEKPPADGHRQTMLAPQFTHVGFGAAAAGRELRLVELYVARYVHIEPFNRDAERKSTVVVTGKVLDRKFSVHYVEVCYEAAPQPPELTWLRTSRPYGLPDDSIILKPMLRDGTLYADGTVGSVGLDREGGFRIPVRLSRNEAGIYTVVIWLARQGSKERFPATNACIRAR